MSTGSLDSFVVFYNKPVCGTRPRLLRLLKREESEIKTVGHSLQPLRYTGGATFASTGPIAVPKAHSVTWTDLTEVPSWAKTESKGSSPKMGRGPSEGTTDRR